LGFDDPLLASWRHSALGSTGFFGFRFGVRGVNRMAKSGAQHGEGDRNGCGFFHLDLVFEVQGVGVSVKGISLKSFVRKSEKTTPTAIALRSNFWILLYSTANQANRCEKKHWRVVF
jgi:hypothetical protein